MRPGSKKHGAIERGKGLPCDGPNTSRVGGVLSLMADTTNGGRDFY